MAKSKLARASNLLAYTGGPRYLRGLRPKNIPLIPKPRITRDHCFGLLKPFFPLKKVKIADNQGKCPRRTNFVHNSRAADSQNRE